MKKMIWMLVWMLAGGLAAKAQSDCVIPMMVLVPDQVEELAPIAENKLESKLRQVVTKNGMDGGARFSNFCIVANMVEGEKEVTSGVRPLVTLITELELFVGNNYTGEKFASTSISLKGAGRNEAKAYTAALGGIHAGNPQIQKFLTDAKVKINTYYTTQIPTIIRQAKSYSIKREYEEALCLLTSVPTCCNNYDLVEKCMMEVYQEYVNYDCDMKVNKARAIWNANQNEEGANQAGAYLAAIDPSSSCWGDALELAEQIRTRIGDNWEFAKELQREAIAIEKSKIEAIRAIGIAYGENQKALTIKESWMVR